MTGLAAKMNRLRDIPFTLSRIPGARAMEYSPGFAAQALPQSFIEVHGGAVVARRDRDDASLFSFILACPPIAPQRTGI
jgi:hypothetical protein